MTNADFTLDTLPVSRRIGERGQPGTTSLLKRLTPIVLLAVLAAGCSASAYKRGYRAAENGNWDEAVDHYRQAVQEHPNRPEYKIALERAMLTASQRHLDAARLAEARGLLEESL